MFYMSVDVIVQWDADGEIKPLRLRVHTADGSEEYTIKGFRQIEHSAGEVHGKYVVASTLVWECSIVISGVRKTVYLFFDGHKWEVTT